MVSDDFEICGLEDCLFSWELYREYRPGVEAEKFEVVEDGDVPWESDNQFAVLQKLCNCCFATGSVSIMFCIFR